MTKSDFICGALALMLTMALMPFIIEIVDSPDDEATSISPNHFGATNPDNAICR
jgi:hypothetical protein